jgi:acetyl esterase/lipase
MSTVKSDKVSARSVRTLYETYLAGHLLPAVFVATLAVSLAAQQALPPQPTSIEGASAHVYKTVSGTELRLHVFSPGNGRSTSTPAVVFFFGGGWTSGTVTQFVPQAKHLADRGMVAVVADYRVFGRHQTSPFEAVADAKSAIRWLRTHGPEFGVDPSRIVGSGGSSGGHIALSAATFDAFDEPGENTKVSSKPDALVLFNPAVDTGRETPPALVQRFSGRGRELSPLHHIRRGLPPTLILHGKADGTVPYSDVEYLPFVFLYGMWQFWILGGLLIAGGVVIGRYVPLSFSLGGCVTGVILLVFAFVGRSIARAEQPPVIVGTVR